MIELNREHFEPEILEVLDQVARLLYVHREMRMAAKTYQANPELDKKQAAPYAVTVLRFTRTVSLALTSALYQKASKRASALRAAYRKALAEVDEAIAASEEMAADVQESIEAASAIAVGIVRNLKYLKQLWQQHVALAAVEQVT